MSGVWLFDVDGCIIDSLLGVSLRPGTVALLTDLRQSGCTVLAWSAGGASYARRRAEEHALGALFDGFYAKDGRDADGRYVLPRPAQGPGVVFVDDRPEDLPATADVIVVSPYLAANPHDRAFDRIRRDCRSGVPTGLVPRGRAVETDGDGCGRSEDEQ
ncbi:MAG: HAD family hydrolase [Acidimicrobiales bacterium]